jgi:hypothetical protein
MDKLLRLLWQWWGDKDHPAEWDGRVYGGGKVSQRMWEYFWAVNQMAPTWKRLVDIGSGPTQFFPSLLRAVGCRVVSIDPEIKTQGDDFGMPLSQFVAMVDDGEWFDCVFSISVLEHVPPADRPQFIADLDKFKKSVIVMTMELGPQNSTWPPVLVEELAMFSQMKNHYLTKMEACPIWAPNSCPALWRPLGLVFYPI